jgi:hypothetical protein
LGAGTRGRLRLSADPQTQRRSREADRRVRQRTIFTWTALLANTTATSCQRRTHDHRLADQTAAVQQLPLIST